jgi:BASS family bile acid:Na+ symporter
LCAGVAVRQWRPTLAERLQKPANLVSKVLNLAVVGFILVTQARLLTDIRPRGFVGMLALLFASWAAGWLLAGPGAGVRRAMTLTTSLRNVGVGLVIASSAFAGTPAVTAVLAFGLFAVAGSLLLALVWARWAPATELLAGGTTSWDSAKEPLEKGLVVSKEGHNDA